jgi:7-keto-8-aminopelargonate synthetase-like enzyme
MDGDLAPLKEIVELKDRHGAWLMLDEAHAVGMFGERRTGLAEAFELANRVEIHMGTLGKALGCAGGYIAGSKILVDWLANRARSFVFSTAPSPAQAESARAAVELVAGAEGAARANALWSLVDIAKNELIRSGWNPGLIRSAILPLKIGGESEAMETASALREAGWHVPAIRYPTVAKGSARLRVTLSANHTRDQIRGLATALGSMTSRQSVSKSTSA